VSGAGRFEVRRGHTLAARLLAVLLRLPRSGPAVLVRVRIDRWPGEHAEVWTRAFGTRRLVSRQYRAGPDVIERIGPVELLFRVTLGADQVGYEQQGTRVRLAGRSVPLPARVCPNIRATARACGEASFLVTVIVAMPRGKALLSYSGRLDEEAPRW